MGQHFLRQCFIAFFSCLAASVGQAEECSREATLKAGPGGAASEITFRNGSTVQRRVYWIDENGQRKLKAVVDGGKTQKQPTASTHAWVITDSAETCLYVVMASAAPMMVDIGGLVAVVEPPAAVPTKAAAAVEKPQRRKTCDPDEVRTARGTCVLRASTCRKNQVYSSSVKQCVLTSATCSPSEVYSSSQRNASPRPS